VAAVRARAQPGIRADIDDLAATLVAPHRPIGGLVGVERPFDVDIEDAVPFLIGDVLGRRVALDPGDAGEHVEAAECGDAFREGVVHVLADGDITVPVQGRARSLRRRFFSDIPATRWHHFDDGTVKPAQPMLTVTAVLSQPFALAPAPA
jgi:hypothetical protein